MVAVLKMLNGVDPASAGSKVTTYLSEQTADTRYWPSDDQLVAQLPDLKLYGNIRQGRLRVVLSAVEQYLRDLNPKYGAVTLPPTLEIEHIMPQGWRTHWDPEPKLHPEASAQRDKRVNTIGNLTLVTKSLNAALSNRPWTNTEAEGLKEGGEPDKGKWTLLDGFNLLVLNKEILSDHVHAWTDDDVVARSKALAKSISAVWPGPSPEVQQAAIDAANAHASHAD
jgi:hypothetical protein